MSEDREEILLKEQEIMEELDTAIAYGREKLRAASESRPFVIVMCGAFSTGKTSLINVLLGCDLPTGINPVTKTVTKLRYGPEQRFLMQSLDGREEWEISEEAARALVVDQEKNKKYREYRLLVELPSGFLQKGILMVDTPGFEDKEEARLDELTKKEIRESDFCIVNFSCNRFGTKDERKFLQDLQELTNGNFISVLNCLNYLMQEGQIEDLQERAEHILKDLGNERIGIGRYFLVDSRDRRDAELSGLDTWLAELLDRKAPAIQADTPLSMALTEMRRATAHSNEYIHSLMEYAAELRNKNEANIREGKRTERTQQMRKQQQMQSRLITWQDQVAAAAEAAVAGADRNTPSNFKEEVQQRLRSMLDSEARKMDNWIRDTGVTPSRTMRTRFQKELKEFSVPEPTYELRERGLLDLDRYLEGRYYRVYNDYVTAARSAVQNRLLAALKNQMQLCVREAEELQKGMEGAEVTGGYEGRMKALSELTEEVSEKSLDAMEVQREVRVRKQKLLQMYG